MIHEEQLAAVSGTHQIPNWAKDLTSLLTHWYGMQQPGPCHSTPLSTPSWFLGMRRVRQGASWAG